jgi:hypothetical protein
MPTGELQEVLDISVVQQMWIHDVVDGYDKHAATSKLLAALVVNSSQCHFTYKDGLIKYKGRI